MKYEVVDRFPVGGNTSVTIRGSGEELRNGIVIHDEHGSNYNLISVAMMVGHIPSKDVETTILVEGEFTGDSIFL